MKLGFLLNGIAHTVLRNFSGEITSVVHDTRKITAGALFICLRGKKADGHNLISEAAAKGASAVLIDAKFSGEISVDIGIVRVENTRAAMALVSANFYGDPAKKLRLVGVTGTNGKTTTTYFIESILRSCGRKTGLIGTVGLRALGEPLDIHFTTDTTPDPPELHFIFAKMLEMGVTDVIMEVSSHALALHKMAGLTFDVGVFTNLTQDHLDFHGTMENYRSAKAQLFTQSNFAVVNSDDEATPTMLEYHGKAPFFTYAINNCADFRALHTVCRPIGSTFDLELSDSADIMPFNIPVGGKFNIYNVLAAIGTACALGIKISSMQAAVARLCGVPGRIQSVPNNRGLNIFVDYAHSPDGLVKIINTVRETTAGRVITIFGCGGDRDKTKRPIMGEIAAQLSDYCILTSDNPRTENPFEILAQIETGVKKNTDQYKIIENRREAICAGIKMLQPADALIIAGKGHEDYQIIGTTKHHFDDFETATEALS
ncbi:MAG: UDP-N-acetylmuramoyl-L-alanyl-D-glutamate--2,6-diaminopimelate ligase [Defluviitaleaceae bacterium]|nr:UDP-N-acetylmuramoyl-L-alanyl-D-glutamate--2,6-diaminopimelate ligase [Defluviitaleaceae bacterium]